MSNDEINEFLDCQSHERFANLFIKYTHKKVIVLDENSIYIFDDTYKYYIQDRTKAHSKLASLVSDVLHRLFESWKNILDDHKQQYKLLKAVKSVETNNFKSSIIKEIITKLMLHEMDIYKLNKLDNYINFRNYKLDLVTGEFEERTDKDFVTEILNYDLHLNVNKKIKNEVQQIIKQICNNNDDDYDFMMRFLGYCLTSLTEKQIYFNAIGPTASNGKSTLMKIFEACFRIYTFKTDKRTFSENYQKAHKFFAGMKDKRVVYVEELDRKKLDTDLIKDTVDGNYMNVDKMHDTYHNLKINFKLLFLSNNIMNFTSDDGIERRTITYYFNSTFLDDSKYEEFLKSPEYETKKHLTFKKNYKLQRLFDENDDYKNAFVHLLIKYSKKYFSEGLDIPKKYLNFTKELCRENDNFKNFVDDKFIITNDENDRIYKEEFREMYNNYGTSKSYNYAWTSILTDISRCRLNYKPNLRVKYNGESVRGVICGIKKRTNDYEEVKFIDDFDARNNPFEKLKKEYEEMKKKLEEMTIERDKYKLLYEQEIKKENKQEIIKNEVEEDEEEEEIEEEEEEEEEIEEEEEEEEEQEEEYETESTTEENPLDEGLPKETKPNKTENNLEKENLWLYLMSIAEEVDLKGNKIREKSTIGKMLKK